MRKQRLALLGQVSANDESFEKMAETREPELEEHAQEERISSVLERLDDREQERIREIDAALARIEAGNYGRCESCGRPIEEERLDTLPATPLCSECSERQEGTQAGEADEAPDAGRLPPDLDGMGDEEICAYLADLVRENGPSDLDELEIRAQNGVIYLEGAVPSEAEREVVLNVLTDIAGVQEIVDHLEIQRLGWERADRSRDEPAQDVLPGTVPKEEPYAGNEDIVLTNEEGVPYEPPVTPPAPPNRKERT